ncbi:MAG: prepilin peptidase [bacterium]|nr:prepilin peptidase [bacterium]
MMMLLAGGVIFGCAAVCGIALATLWCSRSAPLEDGPPPGAARPVALVAGAVLLGIVLVWRGAPLRELGLSALLCIPLAGVWYSDAVKGIVPDAFTLVPLAIVAVYVVTHQAWWLALSAVVPFVPFALAALLSKGRGMGWGDVKLVALGGAVLGAQISLLAFALACLAAVVVSYARGRRGGAIAFAPYLTSAIALAIPIGIAR